MANPREVLTRQAPPPAHTLRYGPLPEQVIDLWPGASAEAPLAVVIHGGFWRPEFDRTHLRPMANALAELGFTVAVPEYRRIGWPGIFQDVAASLDALPGRLTPYGLNPARTVWAGHSAGGHLALWASLRHRLAADSPWYLPKPPDVARVVALAACSDLRLTAELHLDGDAAKVLLGGDPDDVPRRYAATDPAALLPGAVPVVLIHGTGDDRVPLVVSRTFHQQAEKSGSPTELVELPGIEHFGLIDPLSAAWPYVVSAMREDQGSSV